MCKYIDLLLNLMYKYMSIIMIFFTQYDYF
jgi:hypothetical protein